MTDRTPLQISNLSPNRDKNAENLVDVVSATNSYQKIKEEIYEYMDTPDNHLTEC